MASLKDYGSAFKSFFKWVGNGLSSIGTRLTGSRLTGAEREANAFSAQQAQLARDYETQMSNTSYQRGVADMQAAGVNPALMYGQGAAGASTPSSPSPSSVNPADSEGPMGILNLIMSLKTWQQDIKHKSLENDLLESEIKNKDKDTEVKSNTINQIQQNIEESKSRVDNNTVMYKVYEHQADYLKKQTDRYDEVVDSQIAMNMAKAGLDEKQQSVAEATYKRITEENKWISPINAAMVANYYATAGKTKEETRFIRFGQMKTVTASVARSMGVNVAKFFGANGSYSETTPILIVPSEDGKSWEAVGLGNVEDLPKEDKKPSGYQPDFAEDNTD